MLSYVKVYSELRKLANTLYYQTLFIREDLNVFNNNTDLSDIQISFFSLLGFYHNLNMEVNMGEVDSKVYESPIYEDAYMYYKHNKDKKKRDEIFEDKEKKRLEHPNLRNRTETITKEKSQWIFK
ncbi:hypothetical protein LCGC14_0987590 [marine sediment metagenome]|uniref:Uncharacterized protein n=1 Tax=marine sediment metagenome TaxID=412755 RepID=A0A0F9NTD9_9ZZZZ